MQYKNTLLEQGIKNNQALFAVFNEAAQVGLECSLSLVKEQSDYVAKNVGRGLSLAPQLSGLTDAEKLTAFQKEVGEQEYQALRKNSEAVRSLLDAAGESFVQLGKKGQAIVAERVDETIAQTAAQVPALANGQGKVWVDLMQNANKMVSQLVDSGLDWAQQSSRQGADFVLQKQDEAAAAVSESISAVNDKVGKVANAAVAATKAGKRK